MATKKTEKEVVVEKPVEEVAKSLSIKVENAMTEASKVVIKSDEELAAASEMRSKIKTLQKFITQEKKKRVDPAKQTLDWIKSLFVPSEDKVENALNVINRAMITYQDAKAAETKRKTDSIVARAEKGQLKEETAIAKIEELGEVPNMVRTETGKSSFRKDKKMRIIDKSKIPDEYWVVNEVALRVAALAIARSSDRLGEVIPGIEVYEETNISGS